MKDSTIADSSRNEPNPGKVEIDWLEFNYPPLLKLLHFRPSELPLDRKALVMQLFVVHIAILINSFLSFIDNCIEGGLGILYSILFLLIFNPIVLFGFYRGYSGLCRDKSKLSLYTYLQPVIIVLFITVSIVDFLGFNGFIRVSALYKAGMGFPATLALVISLTYMLTACLSGFTYIQICRLINELTKALKTLVRLKRLIDNTLRKVFVIFVP